MPYNTGNPVPSTDARDFMDNVQNTDVAVNTQDLTWTDRLGVSRKTFAGMEKDFTDFLAASGFEPEILEYVDGSPLTVLRPTQLIERAATPGILYAIKLPSAFPASLSGVWADDEEKVVIRVDESLRQELGGGIRRVGSVTDLRSVPGRFDGDRAETIGFYADNPGIGGGSWYWDSADAAPDNGGFVVAVEGVAVGRWRRVFDSLAVKASWFGAVPDYDPATGIGTDSAPAINAALTAAGVCVVELDPGRFKVGTSINMALKPSGAILRGAGGGKIGNSQKSSELYGETGDYPVVDLIGSQFVKLTDLCVLSGFNTPSTVGVHIAREITSQFAQFNTLERVTVQIATSPTANGGNGSVGIHNICGEIFTLRDVYSLADTPVYIGQYSTKYNVQSVYGTLYTGITSCSTFYFEGNCVFQNYLAAGAGVWLDGVTFATGAFYINGLQTDGTFGVKLTGTCRGIDIDAFVERAAHFAMIDNGLVGSKLRFHGVMNANRKVLKNPDTSFVSVLNTDFEFIPTVSGAFTAPDYWIDNAAGDRLTNCRVIAPGAPSVSFSRSASNNRRCEFVSDVGYQQQFTDINTPASAYTLPPLTLGTARFWHDTFGILRTKAGAPSSATDGFPFGVKVGVPATSTSAGAPGQWAAAAGALYIYVGDGTTHLWHRVAIAAW